MDQFIRCLTFYKLNIDRFCSFTIFELSNILALNLMVRPEHIGLLASVLKKGCADKQGCFGDWRRELVREEIVMEKIKLYFGIFLAIIEAVTILFPSFWEQYIKIRYWIDIAYYIWIFSYLSISPKWVALFIVWTFIPNLSGIYEGVKYLNAPDWLLRVDGIINLGFIMYAIVIFEIAKFPVSKWIIQNRIIPEKVVIWWYETALLAKTNELRRLFQIQGKSEIAFVIYQLRIFSEIEEDFQIVFKENSQEVITSVNYREKVIVFESPNRIRQIAQQCLRYPNEEEAFIYLLNHSQI